MRAKLTADAFAYYVSLGPSRNYAAVAKHYGCDKRTVLRHARAGRWQEQLAEIEAAARKNTQQKIGNSLEEMNERHLKVLRAVLGRALEALRATPLRSAADAVRAIDMCVRHERAILDDSDEQGSQDVEQIIRREYDRWLIRTDEKPTSKAVESPARPVLASAKPPTAVLEAEDDDEEEDDDG